MQRSRALPFSTICLHILFTAFMLFLNAVGDNGEPFALPLAFAMASAGLSPVISCCSYFVIQALTGNFTQTLLAFGQTGILCACFLWSNRFEQRSRAKRDFVRWVGLSLALVGFILFAPFTAYSLPFVFIGDVTAMTQKICLACILFVLSTVFAVAVKALLCKLLKCRLRGDELVFALLFFVFIGVGVCRFLGVNAYLGIAFFILLLFSAVTKDCWTLAGAFVLSLPAFLVFRLPIDRFFVYGVCIAVFIRSGRIAAAFALLAVFFAYAYVDGLYAYPTAALVQAVLSAVLPALLFIIFPMPWIRSMENRLIFYREKHLSRIAINRNRAAIGKQLYEISAVFREVENTFTALGTTEAEEGAREYMRASVMDGVCKTCKGNAVCKQKNAFSALQKLIEIGCLKGKVNLIDLPKRLADVCIQQSELLYAVNKRLGEYRAYMTEAENAASGRALLARQAQGVSEILRNLALEQSEPLKLYAERERALAVALQKSGVICSETLICGDEEELTLSLITFGRADTHKIAAIATHVLQAPMMVAEKIVLAGDKFCCILRRKPYFDAAFGVATMKKHGETASGDTHSVLKIDERRFLVALSDGMGSGEYARRISESTISLLESFYRAKMPSDTVLSTVNKLLTFSKEETFACVDIAVVDLDDGVTDIVKIGSPVAFILSGNTVKVLESTSLPLGILDCLRPDVSSYTLQENDILLFLSDGITGAFGSTADLYEVLRTIPLRNPQQLVDGLMERALQSYGGKAKDDMTAIAVRLFKSVV